MASRAPIDPAAGWTIHKEEIPARTGLALVLARQHAAGGLEVGFANRRGPFGAVGQRRIGVRLQDVAGQHAVTRKLHEPDGRRLGRADDAEPSGGCRDPRSAGL